MFMNVTCPTCGHKCRVPESKMGKQVKCPACSRLFQCGSMSPPSLMTHPMPTEKPPPVQAMPQARAVQIQPDQSIHYRCPRCTKPLESPVHMAGQKVNCPDFGQRLQIPQSSDPQPPSPVNKTILATEEPSTTGVPLGSPSHSQSPLPAPVMDKSIPTVIAVSSPVPTAPAQREYCLECGMDISERPRVQTCPDCGSLFCSAACYREHRYHAHPLSR